MDNLLWIKLMQHRFHNVEIVSYGDEEHPVDVCLECTDCNEVILDAQDYNICAKDFE